MVLVRWKVLTGESGRWRCGRFVCTFISWCRVHGSNIHWVLLCDSFFMLVDNQVPNYIPSVSAVTGIRPQTYMWRIAVALHSAPRLAVSLIHFNYYMQRSQFVAELFIPSFKKLVHLNCFLNTVENACLICVTYISNKENYRKIVVACLFFSMIVILWTIGVVVRMSILIQRLTVQSSASICFLLEQETLSALLQSTQLWNEYQVGTTSWRVFSVMSSSEE